MIRIIALLLAFASTFALTACSNHENTPAITQPTEVNVTGDTTDPSNLTDPTTSPTVPAGNVTIPAITIPDSTTQPITEPEEKPTAAPTEQPTKAPTEDVMPVATPKPTHNPTQAATEIATQKPTEAPTQAPTPKPTEAPTQATLSESQAKSIADDLILRHHQYSYSGVCCDLEYDETDMSSYLNKSQKENYWNWQYKITCCHNIGDIRKHVSETIDAAIAGKFTEENLFSDDEGNLYVLVTPMDVVGYGEIVIIEYSADRIVAEAPLQDIDGYLGISDRFIIVKVDSVYLITDVQR